MADKVGFRRVAEWVQSDEDIRAIVVSAGGKTSASKKVTDLLLDAGNSILSGASIKKSLNQFIERVLADAESIGLDNFIKDELMKIEQGVEKDLSLDFILSRGEYFYAKLFSAYYGLPFVDSKDLIGFHKEGSLNFGLCEFQIERAYERYGRFVCGGFYGATPNGKIKTFTRGGSDFSGAIIARGLKAKEYLNFTDVDGIFPFAPNIKKSSPIKEISFDTVRLLGEFGSTVLHPASVLPLYGADTRIIVKNTFNKGAIGTLVKEFCDSVPFAFAIKNGVKYLKIVKRGKGYNLAKILQGQKEKVILYAASLDFLELCYDGEIGEQLIKELCLDFCQIQENVSALYFTLCENSIEKICNLQNAKLPLQVSFFDCGCYVVVREENLKKCLQIILKN